MATIPVLIDAQYQPAREDILVFEDADFRSLLNGMPDCYPNPTDSTLYGAVLRAVAEEMARFDYFYAYDRITGQPQYLTPPDMKRIWSGPLSIPKTFPTSTDTDQRYRSMCVDLIAAYMQGGTIPAIEDVILAYTGDTVAVTELYSLIGNGVYTQSDRNALRIVVPLIDANPMSASATANRIQTIAQSLYAAIDLIKPARSLVNFAISVGGDEDLSDRILGIQDSFLPVMQNAETSPLEDPFTVSPFLDLNSPDTTVAAQGILAGAYLAKVLTAAQWQGLMSDSLRAEYTPDGQGNYVFSGSTYDVLLTDANDQITGEVSKAEGVLAPQQTATFIIKSDSLSIYELD